MWIDDATATPAAVGKSSKSWFLRHKILTAIAALFLVGAIGSAFGSDEDPATTATSDSKPTTSTSSTTTSATTPATTTSSTTTTTTAAAVTTTKTTAPPKPKPFKELSAREFAKLVKNPDAYEGRRVIVYAEVFQFDAATGDSIFLANIGHSKKRPSYGFVDYSDVAMFDGDADKLDDVVEGDLLTIKATVTGSFSYDTQIGGNTTVPRFEISSFKRYGSTKS